MKSFSQFLFESELNLYDEDGEYESLKDLIYGVKNGGLLIHVRKHDGTNFQYGIDPSAGDFLSSTEGYNFCVDEFGEGPELIFFSDNFNWVTDRFFKIKGGNVDNMEVVFVRKNKTIQKSLGDGRVELYDGKIISYERSPMADYEDPLFKDEPCGVEENDWYTNRSQDVVAVVPAKMLKDIK